MKPIVPEGLVRDLPGIHRLFAIGSADFREAAADFREAAAAPPALFRESSPPALGAIGADAVREAFDGDLRDLQTSLQAAVRKELRLGDDKEWMPYVQGLFEQFIVVEDPQTGKLLRYPYTASDGAVTLGEPVEVRKAFEPISGAGGAMNEAAGAFLEAGGDAASGTWRIRVIRAGLSLNDTYYSDALLREAAPMFDGVRVFAKSDEEHLGGKGKDVRNLIGALSAPKFVEGKGKDKGELQATFTLIEPEGVVAVKLREAWKRGLTTLFGFSIDAVGQAKRVTRGGKTFREALKFVKLKSVDLIVEPGAGGAIIDLVESKKETVMDRAELIALLEAKGLLEGKNAEKLSDEQLVELLRESVRDVKDPDPDPALPPAGVSSGEMREALRMVEARADMRVAIAESSLPKAARDRLRARFDAAASFTEAEVETAIADEAAYIAGFTESGRVVGLGDFTRIESGETRAEKVAAMLDAFFDPNHKDHRHARSFKECYVQITGDRRVSGILRECDASLMRESLDSSSWADVLGNSITRRMIADYNLANQYDVWRRIATTVPVADFRTQERTRYGGYGDLPTVAEAAPYTALGSPTDEKATYAVVKRGGTEDVTLEMIKNDDVGSIQRIPIKLARAAKRTLAKFVLDFIRTNPTIYDSVALFHGDHGNLGSAALDATTLAAARLRMLKQAELDSADRLGIGPKSLLVPPDLEEAAVDLFRRNTNNDQTFVNSLTLDVLPAWYWTDTNDWAIAADPMDCPTIEIGFLDGDEEPALFVQDNPTVGSMFSNDKLTYKIRHPYGGNVVDFRGLDKSVVA